MGVISITRGTSKGLRQLPSSKRGIGCARFGVVLCPSEEGLAATARTAGPGHDGCAKPTA